MFFSDNAGSPRYMDTDLADRCPRRQFAVNALVFRPAWAQTPAFPLLA